MPDLSRESELTGVVAGFDEVGRGPLAGPVVAAAVSLDRRALPSRLVEKLDDSKRLSAGLREELAALVRGCALVGLGQAEAEEIDRLNILQATFLAMRRAQEALGVAIDWALVDGNRAPPLAGCRVRCIVGGDGLSLSIAAASVVAKVHRDALMTALAADHPAYGWDRNAGYGTPQHLQALRRFGPTPHHRRSFAPVAAVAVG